MSVAEFDQDFAIAFEHRGFRLRARSRPARRSASPSVPPSRPGVDEMLISTASRSPRPPRRSSSRTKSPADPPMSFTAMFLPFRLAMRAAKGLSGLRPACSRKPFRTTRKFGKPFSELPNAFSAWPFSTALRDVADAGAADLGAAADHAGDHVGAGADVDDGDVEAVLVEIAHLLRDIGRGEEQRGRADRDADLLGRAGATELARHSIEAATTSMRLQSGHDRPPSMAFTASSATSRPRQFASDARGQRHEQQREHRREHPGRVHDRRAALDQMARAPTSTRSPRC